MRHSDREKETACYDEDMELIGEPEHIEMVWEEILKNLPTYLVAYRNFIAQEMSARGGKLAGYISSILTEYDKGKDSYDAFLDLEVIEEHSFDTNNFKQELRKKCPIFLHCWQSKSPVMVEWHLKYRMCPSDDLYHVLKNLLEFAIEYKKDTDGDDYGEIDDAEDFIFEELDDKYHRIFGVVGTGIQSTILYHISPEFFPGGFRQGMWTLYFLSGKEKAKEDLGWPSETSEFLMVRDTVYDTRKPMVTDHNYDYPYSVYTLYCLKIFQEMIEVFNEEELYLDTKYRYVFVTDFFKFVHDVYCSEGINILRAGDDKEKNGWMW